MIIKSYVVWCVPPVYDVQSLDQLTRKLKIDELLKKFAENKQSDESWICHQYYIGLFLCLFVSPKWHKWWHQSSSMASRQLLRENEPAPVLAHSNGWVGWRMRSVAGNLICGYLVCVEGNIRQLFVSYCFPGFVVLGWVVLGWVGLCWVRVTCVLAFFLLLSDWLFWSFLQRARCLVKV